MPMFNAARYVCEAMDSVRAQTHKDWELIVVDDCSTDNSVALVEQYLAMDSRIRLIRAEKNSGSPATPRNSGIDVAVGRYIAFLDPDDRWAPAKLELQLSYMEDNNAAISCTGYGVINESGHPIGGYQPPGRTDYRELLKENTIGCLTAMYDTRALGKRYFQKCGHEDYALWLSIAKEGYTVYGLPDALAFYRISSGSVSSNKVKVLKFFWNIYRNIEGFSAARSLFMCLRYAWNARSKYKTGT